MFLKQVHFLETVRLIAEISEPIHEPCLSVNIIIIVYIGSGIRQ